MKRSADTARDQQYNKLALSLSLSLSLSPRDARETSPIIVTTAVESRVSVAAARKTRSISPSYEFADTYIYIYLSIDAIFSIAEIHWNRLVPNATKLDAIIDNLETGNDDLRIQ